MVYTNQSIAYYKKGYKKANAIAQRENLDSR